MFSRGQKFQGTFTVDIHAYGLWDHIDILTIHPLMDATFCFIHSLGHILKIMCKEVTCICSLVDSLACKDDWQALIQK